MKEIEAIKRVETSEEEGANDRTVVIAPEYHAWLRRLAINRQFGSASTEAEVKACVSKIVGMKIPNSYFDTFRNSRDSGYGDMVFSRLSKWDKQYAKGVPHNEKILLSDAYLRMESFAYPQTQSTVQPRPFPFFELPLEVRDRIYEWMLVEVSIDHLNKGYGSSSVIEIDKHRTERDVSLASFEQWLDLGAIPDVRTRKLILDHYSDGNGPNLPGQYMKEKNLFHESIAPPCFRKSNYNMKIRGSSRRIPAFCWADQHLRTDWFMVKQIMHLSNVSTKFRAEFSKVFWSTVYVRVGDCGSFLDFLKDRPAVCSAIKIVTLSPQKFIFEDEVFEDLDELDERTAMTDDTRAEFIACCSYLSKHLKFDQVVLEISCFADDLAQLEEGTGPLTYLLALKTLNFSRCKVVDGKKFQINLSMNVPREFFDEEGQSDAEGEAEFRLAWGKRMEKILMPNSLKAPKLSDEKALYLQTRLEAGERAERAEN